MLKRQYSLYHQWAAIVLLLMVAACSVTFLLVTMPYFTGTLYYYDDIQKPPVPATMPLIIPSAGKMLFVTTTMYLPKLHATTFTVIPDDCLRSLIVNGQTVPIPDGSFCDYTRGKSIDLSRFLKAGDNFLKFTVEDNGSMGGINVRSSSTDSIYIAFFLLLFILSLPLTLIISQSFKRHDTAFTLILFVAIALRILYMFTTPYNVRSHDVDGHIEYVRYAQEHWSMPQTQKSFEFYHPPAYYFLGAATCRSIADTPATCTNALQSVALALSIATLLILAWMAWFIFPAKYQRTARLLFLSLAGTLPGLIYFAARINNDVLLQFLTFTSLALMLKWWRRPSHWTWYALILCLAGAILSKSNALILLPIAGILMIFSSLKQTEKVWHGCLSLMLLLAICGNIIVLRPGGLRDGIIGNIGNLSSGLAVANGWDTYLTFEPSEILKHPFNNVWLESERRQYFYEYLLRSAYFGEFSFDMLAIQAKTVLFFGMLSLLPLLYGLYQTLRNRIMLLLPLWLCMGLTMAGHALLRYRHPFSSLEDFRYIIFIVPALAAIAVYGIRFVKDALVRRTLIAILALSATANAVFILSIYLFSF